MVYKTNMISNPNSYVAIKIVEKAKIVNIKNLIKEFDALCLAKH